MTIARYISVIAVLVAGLVLANASGPEVVLAQAPASTTPTGFQCSVPVNSWCVPATSGAAACVRYTNGQGQVKTVCPEPTPAYALGEAIGTILAFPFVAVQSLLGSCP